LNAASHNPLFYCSGGRQRGVVYCPEPRSGGSCPTASCGPIGASRTFCSSSCSAHGIPAGRPCKFYGDQSH
jgi:hypothetical protein